MRHEIFASGNCPGTPLIKGVAGLQASFQQAALFAADYPDRHLGSCVAAITSFTGAPSEAVLVIGSGLKQLSTLVRRLQPSAVVALDGDFRGYSLASQLDGVSLVAVPAKSGNDPTIYAALANAVRDLLRPLVMATVGVTNPLATAVDAVRLVDAIKSANPSALIVLDTAYVEYVGVKQADLTHLALGNNGIMILAPGSKILYAAGAASGWLITGDRQILKHLRSKAFPFEPSGIGSWLIAELIARIDHVDEARALVKASAAILGQGCCSLFGPQAVIAGTWPWVLVDAGDEAHFVTQMLKDRGIHVQQQSGMGGQMPSNWIRISATVPAEAVQIIEALQQILHGSGRPN